jgi:hypothetical protein
MIAFAFSWMNCAAGVAGFLGLGVLGMPIAVALGRASRSGDDALEEQAEALHALAIEDGIDWPSWEMSLASSARTSAGVRDLLGRVADQGNIGGPLP